MPRSDQPNPRDDSNRSERRRERGRWLPLTLLAASLALASLPLIAGCNLVAAGYFVVKGPPKVPAAYTLDPLKKTVIFIDDRANELPRKSLIEEVGRTAESLLLRKGAIEQGNMITSRSATLAARQERFGDTRSIVEIGQDVGAETIIYVTFDAFTLTPDRVSFLPSSTIRVKILDVATGARLWPADDPLGQSITMTMPQGQGTAPTDRAEVLQAEDQLANWVGVGLSQLFYEHERTDDRKG